MYFGDHPLRPRGRLGFHFDGQLRMEGFGDSRNQLLLRPGLNFDINDSVQLSGGYAFIDTKTLLADGTRFDRPENRLWEQLVLRHGVGRARLTHRYRLEQRFIGRVVDDVDGEQARIDGYNYQGRFRYFVKTTLPLGESSRFVSFYNELMVSFGANVRNNFFDQNRTYGALGLRLGSAGTLELGYLLQIVQRPSGDVFEYNHTVQIGFFSSRPIR